MESLFESLKAAHEEVMRETGWGALAGNLTEALRQTPEMIHSIGFEVRHFLFAVNWSEPFFRYLAAFHACALCVSFYLAFWRWRVRRPKSQAADSPAALRALASSRAEEKLFVLSVVLIALAFTAIPLNKLGFNHGHRLFVSPHVNYFDETGIFIGVVYWLPLVLLALCVQARLIFNVIRLMVVAKRERMKAAYRQQRAAERAAKKSQ